MYLSKVDPIKECNSEITNRLLALSEQGERMLETGCGGGILSAELALAGRVVSVCDFSQSILDRTKLLFRASGLNTPESFLMDLTKPMPFMDGQFDIVWNSGVLEHWTDEELKPIMNELARCAKRCVISFVPNERSVFYRYGRESAEQHGIAPWGREIPRSSLKSLFEDAGLINVQERTVCVAEAPNLISKIDPVFQRKIKQWWDAVSDEDPVKDGQGYLLLTVGYKKNANP
jgi:SAM-dependent methyltransferase